MRSVRTLELKQPLYTRQVDFKRPLYLVGFGCVHKGSPNHASHDWQKFCEHYKNFQKKNQCFYIGLGDYIEFFSARERNALASPDLHESTICKMDDDGQEMVDDFHNDISFMGDNLLGLIEGNHHWGFSDGTTSTMRLCNKLKCLYLSAGLYGKLKCVDGKNLTRYTVDIYAAHGSGNAVTISGSLTKMERFAGSIKANIFLLGHDHQHLAADVPLIELAYTHDGKAVRSVEYRRCVVRCGSFMRVHSEGSISYAIQKLYKPTGIGNAQVEINFATNKSDRYLVLNPCLRTW